MKNLLKTLSMIFVAILATALLSAQCGPNQSSSGTSQGCCFSGPQCECDPEEHEFETTGHFYWFYTDTCNPENNIVYDEPIGPDYRTVTVAPWTQVCGVNYWAYSYRFFMTYGEGNCAQCGSEEKTRQQYENCSF